MNIFRRLVAGIVALGVCVCLLGGPWSARAAEPYTEDAVKAVFLYRFAGYVAWPSNTLSTPFFTIAVAGDEAVADELTGFLPTHPIGAQKAQLRRVTGPDDVGDAQIVYIGDQYHGDLRAFMKALAGRPVLVVTDSSAGLSAGAVVNFVLIAQHVRFEVSIPAATRAGLKISGQLLAVASHVDTSWNGPYNCAFSLAVPATQCSPLALL